jgi:hypothetical protein
MRWMGIVSLHIAFENPMIFGNRPYLHCIRVDRVLERFCGIYSLSLVLPDGTDF